MGGVQGAERHHARRARSTPTVSPCWGFEQLLHHRIPLYKAIADNFGYTIRMRDVPAVQSEEDFTALVADAIDQTK